MSLLFFFVLMLSRLAQRVTSREIKIYMHEKLPFFPLTEAHHDAFSRHKSLLKYPRGLSIHMAR